jgi:D-alanyl-D-alanine carboxypeptidase
MLTSNKLSKCIPIIVLLLTIISVISLISALLYTNKLEIQASENLADAHYISKKLKAKNTVINNNIDNIFNKNLQKKVSTLTPTILTRKYDKLIYIDLYTMKLYTYANGIKLKTIPVLSKGKVGSRWETPAGLYDVEFKKTNHVSSVAQVNLPFSMGFSGNFFIHGWPTYMNGDPVPNGYSGGCIRLGTDNAKFLYNFAEAGTKILITNQPKNISKNISIDAPLPSISAESFIIGDLESDVVYAAKNTAEIKPIASITKLITALTANSIIRYNKKIYLSKDTYRNMDWQQLDPDINIAITDSTYPLLMQSNNVVAHAIANNYGYNQFITKMKRQVNALGMINTSIDDPSGISSNNTSTTQDLFRLAKYLYYNSQFLLNITKLRQVVIKSDTNKYTINNYNHFANNPDFIGGKTGYTNAAGETMLSIFKVNIQGEERIITIIVLDSKNRKKDILKLYNWFQKYATTESTNKLFVQNNITIIKGPVYNNL